MKNCATEHITRAVHEFYLGSTPKACGGKEFLYRIMKGHAGDTMEFVKGPHLQDYIYDSNGNVGLEVMLCGPIQGEMMIWDIKHMLDIEIL